MKNIVKIGFLVVILTAFLPIYSAHAGFLPIVQCGTSTTKECNTCDLFAMVKRMIDFGIYVFTPAVATAFFIYAGFLMLLSGANPGLFGKAKGIFTNTIYGVAIVLTAWLITNTFIINFGPANAQKSWSEFTCPAGLP